MTKPCSCSPPDPAGCPLCWHYLNTPFYRALWAEDAARPVRDPPGTVRVSAAAPAAAPPPAGTVSVAEPADVDAEQTRPYFVATTVVGCVAKKMYSIGRELLKAAAERWDADLVLLQPSGQPNPMGEKFRLAAMLDGDRWERGLFIDADCLVNPLAPSPFDLVPPDRVGLMPERHYYARRPNAFFYDNEVEAMLRSQGLPTDPAPAESYNTGLMVLSARPDHAAVFDPPKRLMPWTHCWEQNWINYRVWAAEVPVHRLPPAWNYIYWPRPHEFLRDRLDAEANVLHFAGIQEAAVRLELMARWASRLQRREVAPAANCDHVVL